METGHNSRLAASTYVTANNIQAGGDVTITGIAYYINPYQGPDPLPLDLRTNIQNFLAHYLGTKDHPVPFGGRADALRQLEKWRIQSTKQFLLLATPAGRGKSALLTRWVQHLDVGAIRDEVAVVFVPISIRFGTNLPDQIFPCIAVQLAGLLGKDIPSDTIHMTPSHWHSLVGEYLREPLPNGRQLLLIVDGLDEAAWDVGPDLFPYNLPTTTRIVVSARYLAGEVLGPEPWLGRLGWDRLNLAEAIPLAKLTRAGVMDVLARMGNPLDVLTEKEAVIRELYRLTEGDPLLVELYVGWLNEQGEASVWLQPTNLAAIEPDYRGFFRYWWEEQEKLWKQRDETDPLERKAVITLLKILALALGPLRVDDLRTLSPNTLPSKITIRGAVKPLQRFVLGDGEEVGYSFAHPRLADYFRKEFLDELERREWQEIFVRWGRQVIEGLRNAPEPDFDSVSRYLLFYYSRHLEAAKEAIESYLWLLSWEWFQSWHHYTGTYAGFLRDVDVVLKQLVSADRKAIIQGLPATHIGHEILCILWHASLNSLSNNIPTELLVTLRQFGNWTDEQALAYARQRLNSKERIKTLLALAPYLTHGRQQEIFQEALYITQTVPGIYEISSLVLLAPHLPKTVFEIAQFLEGRDPEEVLTILAARGPKAINKNSLSLQYDENRGILLTAVIPYLSDPERTEAVGHAFRLAQISRNEKVQATVLASLVPYIPEAEQSAVLHQALQVAQRLQDDRDRAEVLTVLAPHLPNEVFETAQTLSAINRETVLVALAPHLPNKVFEVVHVLQYPWRQVGVLIALAPHIPEAIFKAAQSSEDNSTRVELLVALASYMPKAVFEAVQTLQHSLLRARVLTALVPHLPNTELIDVRHQALQEIQTLENWQKSQLLVALVPYLKGQERAEVLHQAVEAAQVLQDEKGVVIVLKALAPYLPAEVHQASQALREEQQREVLVALACLLPDKVFKAVLELQNAGHKEPVLSALAAYRPQAVFRIAQTLPAIHQVKVLTAVAPYLPQDEQSLALGLALRVAKSLRQNETSTKVIISLVPVLPETDRSAIISQTLQMALGLPSEQDRANALIALAPYLPDVTRTHALQQALQTIRNMQINGNQARLLAALAPHLSEMERPEILKRWLESAQLLKQEQYLREVLTSLAPYLPEEVFEAAKSLATTNQTSVFVALAPYLPNAVFEASRVWEGKKLTKVLTAIALHLDDPERTAMLKRALDATQTIEGAEDRAEALAALGSYLATLPTNSSYAIWMDNLSILRRIDRRSVLFAIAGLLPLIRTLGGDESLSQVLQAIKDIYRWWS